MVNVYVHLEVRGLPRLGDEELGKLLEVFFTEMSVGVGGPDVDGTVTLTQSQFALSNDSAARRQCERAERTFALAGYPDVVVTVAEMVREDWRDDASVLLDAACWRLIRRLRLTGVGV